MREDKLSFAIIIRVLFSLLPILFGMPTVATIVCAYNIAMTFLAVGPLATTVSSLFAVAGAMFICSTVGVGGEVTGLVIGIQAVLAAVGCIIGLFKKRDFYKGLFLATGGILLPQIIYENSVAHSNGMRLADMLVPSIEDFNSIVAQTFETFPAEFISAAEQVGVTVEMVSQLSRNLMIMIIPSVIIVSSLAVAYILMWAVASPLRRMTNNQKIHSFSRIKIPCGFTIVSILATIYLLFFANSANSMVVTILLNMLIVISAIALLAGVSFADYYFRKALPFALPRIIIHVLVIINFFPAYILAAMIDSFANFRKLSTKTDETGGGDYETKK